jgi:hypothetical protein
MKKGFVVSVYYRVCINGLQVQPGESCIIMRKSWLGIKVVSLLVDSEYGIYIFHYNKVNI